VKSQSDSTQRRWPLIGAGLGARGPNLDFALAMLAVVVIGIVVAVAHPSLYVVSILNLSLIYMVVCLGYNIVLTVCGLFHFGFALHFAIGGYVVGMVMVRLGWGTPAAILAVFAVSALVSAILTIPALQFRGDYLCIVTLAFAEIVRTVIINWTSFTNGPIGIPGIPPPTFAGPAIFSPVALLAFVGTLALVALIAYHRLTSSKLGLVWDAIRLNEEATTAAGYRVRVFKAAAIIIGSLFAGLGGLAYAHYASIVEPSMASVDVTILLITVVILGGGSMMGMLGGALIITAAPQLLLGVALYRQLALGLLLVVVANWRPDGISFVRKRRYGHLKATTAGKAIHTAIGARAKPAHTQSGYCIQASGLVKRFGGLVAVDGLSIDVPEDSIFGIIGPNGAGKTTAFNLVTGVYRPDEGTITLLGRDVTGMPQWQITRLGVARTFQNIKLWGKLTALDNVLVSAAQRTFGRMLGNSARQEIVDAASGAIDFVGLSDYVDSLAGSLPYALQRRLEVARALAARPRIILLDEPSAGMNPTEQEDLSRLVKGIRDSGISVVLIEHNVQFMASVADQVLVMVEGKSLRLGTPTEIVADPAVIEAYLGRRAIRV
jgi:ABC-type branched-subunit amino acid transport system ATPase component/ABC-type branched-subunit amino acid transport system permease subunit